MLLIRVKNIWRGPPQNVWNSTSLYQSCFKGGSGPWFFCTNPQRFPKSFEYFSTSKNVTKIGKIWQNRKVIKPLEIPPANRCLIMTILSVLDLFDTNNYNLYMCLNNMRHFKSFIGCWLQDFQISSTTSTVHLLICTIWYSPRCFKNINFF